MDFIAAFADALNQHGLNPRGVVADGKFHRFDAAKKGKKAGYYKLSPEGFGVFGDWSTGIQHKFSKQGVEKMSAAERQQLERQYKEAMRKGVERTKNAQEAAAKKSQEAYVKATECTQHDYLSRKGIKSHIAKLAYDGRLIIPIYNADNVIVNVQYINRAGKKLFLKDGKKADCRATICGDKKTIFIAEGFATAASIHEATGCETVIAFDCGNLLSVARVCRKIYGQDALIVIAGDNDEQGTTKAHEAAQEISAIVKIPTGINGSDWNDAASEGVDIKRLLLPDDMPPPPTIQDYEKQEIIVTAGYELDAHGKPKCTKENLALICCNRGITLRYNIIAKREEMIIPNAQYSLDNAENAAFAHILSECKRDGLSTSHVREYLTNLCDQNIYNPVARWVTSKPWDGFDRHKMFYGTLLQEGEDESEDVYFLKCLKMRRWMLSAIAAAFNPDGVSAHGMLVLQGRQYLGKTQWFKSLVPRDLDLTKDGFILRTDDKDSLHQCLSHWLVELGELDATFKKSDIAQLKAFLTADRDIMRLAYAAKKSTFARRTVFFASVNQKEFLHDETGNRRFWVIPCEEINALHGLDMQQVWAQFYQMWLDGENHYMTQDEITLINADNTQFEGHDSVQERVMRHFNWHDYNEQELHGNRENWLTATEVAKLIGIQNPTNLDAQKCANAIKKLNNNLTKRQAGTGAKLLLLPAKRHDD